LVAACQDPEIVRWTRVSSDYGASDARAYLMQRYDAVRAGATAPFAIIRAPDGPLLGSISLMRITWEDARAEVGYWLARSYMRGNYERQDMVAYGLLKDEVGG
jgi:RimJ/RimL family protein N-acetyltransferase